MKIDGQTKYEDFQAIEAAMTEESKQEIKRASEAYYKSCYELTIDEFFGVVAGNYEILGDMSKPSVLQVYWLKRFTEFCEEFARACERLSIKDPEAEKYNAGCVKFEPQEGMLVFLREYFGLPSFYDAGKRTIGEYLTARKDRYNALVMRRNQEAEMKRKMKAKR